MKASSEENSKLIGLRERLGIQKARESVFAGTSDTACFLSE